METPTSPDGGGRNASTFIVEVRTTAPADTRTPTNLLPVEVNDVVAVGVEPVETSYKPSPLKSHSNSLVENLLRINRASNTNGVSVSVTEGLPHATAPVEIPRKS
jgi:hypothetical protein